MNSAVRSSRGRGYVTAATRGKLERRRRRRKLPSRPAAIHGKWQKEAQ
jgi:hypothetical protein